MEPEKKNGNDGKDEKQEKKEQRKKVLSFAAIALFSLLAIGVGLWISHALPEAFARWNAEGELALVLAAFWVVLMLWFVFVMKSRGNALVYSGVIAALTAGAVYLIFNFDAVMDAIGVLGVWGIGAAIVIAIWIGGAVILKRDRKKAAAGAPPAEGAVVIKKMETDEEIRGKAFVHWRAWHEAYPGLVSEEALEKLTLEKCEEIAFKWRDNLLVAVADGRVAGFVGFGVREGEDPDVGEIFALYVLPEYFGKGVGRLLMQAGLDRLKEYPRVCLWVLKENARAIRFYEKCGFAPDGAEKWNDYASAAEIRMILTR